MIGKVTKGSSFAGILNYLFKTQERTLTDEEKEHAIQQSLDTPEGLNNDFDDPNRANQLDYAQIERLQQESAPIDGGEAKSRGTIIATNMAGRNARELASEFRALKALNPEMERVVFHCSVSTPPEDKVSHHTQAKIADKLASRMGFENTTWVAVAHENEHGEFHLVASRSDYDGGIISDEKDYEKVEGIMRELEIEFDLTRVQPSREAMRKSVTQGELKHFERTGELSVRMKMQAQVDAILSREVTLTEFIEELGARSTKVFLKANSDGEIKGIVYKHDGRFLKGRDLGRGYTFDGLQKAWTNQEDRKGRMTYEYERDHEVVSRAIGQTDYRNRTERRRESTGRALGGDERALGSDRETSDQSNAGRREIRQADRAASSQGGIIEERGGGSSLRTGRRSTPEQRTGGGEPERDQQGVSEPQGKSKKLLPDNAQAEGNVRTDDRAVQRYGGDNQRGLPQGQRRDRRGIEESADSSRQDYRGSEENDQRPSATSHENLREAAETLALTDGSASHYERSDRGSDGRMGDLALYSPAGGGSSQSGSQSVIREYSEDKALELLPEQDVATRAGRLYPHSGITDDDRAGSVRKEYEFQKEVVYESDSSQKPGLEGLHQIFNDAPFAKGSELGEASTPFSTAEQLQKLLGVETKKAPVERDPIAPEDKLELEPYKGADSIQRGIVMPEVDVTQALESPQYKMLGERDQTDNSDYGRER
ncbi:MAG: relaxase/mobilization nuclease domain-containing protein [Pyrinomonadaceae bacterium]